MNTSTVPFALAVDDVPIILMDMTLILEDAGFRCHEAMDGDTAIVLLEEQADNTILLFSDGEMPGLSIGVQKGPPIGVQKGPPSSSSVTGMTGALFALVAA